MVSRERSGDSTKGERGGLGVEVPRRAGGCTSGVSGGRGLAAVPLA